MRWIIPDSSPAKCQLGSWRNWNTPSSIIRTPSYFHSTVLCKLKLWRRITLKVRSQTEARHNINDIPSPHLKVRNGTKARYYYFYIFAGRLGSARAPSLSRAASTRHHPYLYLFIIPVKTCRTSSLSPPLFILNINTPSPWLSCPPQLRGEAAFREGNAVDRSDQVMVDIMGTVTHGYIPNNGPILYPLHKNVWSTHPLDKTGGVIHAARG